MFVRVKTVKSGSKEYQYYQLVEGVYKKGRVRQKVLMTLGRVDDFDRSKVDEIVSALEGYTDKVDVLSSIEDCHHVWSKEYGSVYVMEKLWHELKMDSILSGLLRDRQFEFDVQAAIRGMVINRAVNARSKLATYEWMDRDVYYSEREELELHHLYRALDFLISHKNAIENRIFSNLTDLFSMDVSVVFYDCSLVDMYGENSELVQHSRKGRQQFLLTLVMSRDGLPIGHEVLPGNMPDIKTVVDAMAKLKDRYSIGRCIFVGDRGMVSQEKLDQLKGLGHDYKGRFLRRRKDGSLRIDRAQVREAVSYTHLDVYKRQALGGAVTMQADILNIALEGMMLVGAFFSVAASHLFSNAWLGLVAGVIASTLIGLLYAFFVVDLKGDTFVIGVALNIFAAGGTVYLLRSMFGVKGAFVSERIRTLPDISIGLASVSGPIAEVLDGHSILTYMSWALVVVFSILFYRTTFGLRLRAAGEHPVALRCV